MAISQIVTNSIATGAVSAADLADGSVTNDKLSLSANASNIATALNATGSAPIYACRAWVNFNGTGTVAIRASGNVSSITDNGTGDYTVNFTNAMPDSNYSGVSGLTSDGSTGTANPRVAEMVNTSSSAMGMRCMDTTNGTAGDMVGVYVAIFR